MKNFQAFLAEDRRRAILLLLKETGGVLNERVLKAGLERLGHYSGLTQEALREDIQFLADRGLCRIDWFEDKFMVVHLKRRGTEVAEGRVHVDGVKRPEIGE